MTREKVLFTAFFLLAAALPAVFVFAYPLESEIVEIAVDESGARVAVLDKSCTITVWDAARGETLKQMSCPTFGPLEFSPDGKWLVALGSRRSQVCKIGGTVYWDTTQWKMRSYELSLEEIAFKPDGNWFGLTLKGHFVQFDPEHPDKVRDLGPPRRESGEVTKRQPYLWRFFLIDALNRGLGIRKSGLEMELLDVTGDKKLIDIPIPYKDAHEAYIHENRLLLLLQKKGLRVLDIESGASLGKFDVNPEHGLFSIAVDPSGKYVFIRQKQGARFQIQDILQDEVPYKYDNKLNPIFEVVFQPGKSLVVIEKLDSIEAFNLKKRRIEWTIPKKSRRAVLAFSGDGSRLFGTEPLNRLYELDVKTGAFIRELGVKQLLEIRTVRFSGNGEIMGIQRIEADGRVRRLDIYDPARRKVLASFKTSSPDFILSFDGAFAAYATRDNITVRRVADGTEVLRADLEESGTRIPFCFLRDNRLVLMGEENPFVIPFQARLIAAPLTLKSHTALWTDPKGKYLYSANIGPGDSNVRKWNIPNTETEPQNCSPAEKVKIPKGKLLVDPQSPVSDFFALFDSESGKVNFYNRKLKLVHSRSGSSADRWSLGVAHPYVVLYSHSAGKIKVCAVDPTHKRDLWEYNFTIEKFDPIRSWVSAGRKYVAVLDESAKIIRLLDAETGKETGALTHPRDGNYDFEEPPRLP